MLIQEKIIFLMQIYFAVSILGSLIVLIGAIPAELRMRRKYKRTWLDNLSFIKNILILFFGFPIIAFYFGVKEF